MATPNGRRSILIIYLKSAGLIGHTTYDFLGSLIIYTGTNVQTDCQMVSECFGKILGSWVFQVFSIEICRQLIRPKKNGRIFFLIFNWEVLIDLPTISNYSLQFYVQLILFGGKIWVVTIFSFLGYWRINFLNQWGETVNIPEELIKKYFHILSQFPFGVFRCKSFFL